MRVTFVQLSSLSLSSYVGPRLRVHIPTTTGSSIANWSFWEGCAGPLGVGPIMHHGVSVIPANGAKPKEGQIALRAAVFAQKRLPPHSSEPLRSGYFHRN